MKDQREAMRTTSDPHQTTAAVHAYSSAAKWLHWLIVVLLAIQFTTAFLLPHIGRNTPPGTVINLHFSIGVLVLVVMAVRFLHRLMYPVPLEAKDAQPWERLLAKTVHRLFYLILLVGPFLGWASASAHRLPVSLFGMVPLPPLAQPGAGWAHSAGDIHGTAMWLLLWLVGLHAAAALYHHLVRHDGTLRRMLPSRQT
jgi:cytochrome b561